jgi:hypothetical protein
MARSILIVGPASTGKTTAFRTLDPASTLMILPNNKDLPWQGWEQQYNSEKKNLVRVEKILDVPPIIELAATQRPHIKNILVDDTTHLQNNRMFSDAFIRNKDWGKWNMFGADMYKMMFEKMQSYRDDLNVFFAAHADPKDDGSIGVRTSGKLLDNTIDIPSYFTYVFHSAVTLDADKKPIYYFITNNDGTHLAKTPMGMFDQLHIPNDMAPIVSRIITYSKLGKKSAGASDQKEKEAAADSIASN